jgi:geranylgeranyl pyrophosphate synthase
MPVFSSLPDPPSLHPTADEWFAPLAVHQPAEFWTLDKALEGLTPTPITGLGSSWIGALAHYFGAHRIGRREQHAMILMELYFHPQGDSSDGPIQGYLRKRTTEKAILGTLEEIWTKQRVVLENVIQSWIRHSPGALGDLPVSGGPLFFRFGVDLAAFSSGIPLQQLAPLRRVATVLGLMYDWSTKQLSGDQWAGAAQTLDLPASPPERFQTLTQTFEHELSLLPSCPDFGQLLLRCVAGLHNETTRPHPLPPWVPHLGDVPPPRSPQDPHLEQKLSEYVDVPAPTIQTAIHSIGQRGGKRLRPQILTLCAQLCGGNPEQAMEGACAIEWLHQGSLIVDDLMDEADLRRGQASLHTLGTPSLALGAFGSIMSRLLETIASNPTLYDAPLRYAVFSMARGQWLESRHSRNLRLSRSALQRIHRQKTASLFETAAWLGATAAHGTTTQIKALRQYGESFGMAFQHSDDLLDAFGDPTCTGKPTGMDISTGKITLPTLYLLEETQGTHAYARLAALLVGQRELCGEDRKWLAGLYRELHIQARVQQVVQGHIDGALKTLTAFEDCPKRHRLQHLAQQLLGRTQ